MKGAIAIGAGFLIGWGCEYLPEKFQGPCHLAAEICAGLLGGHG